MKKTSSCLGRYLMAFIFLYQAATVTMAASTNPTDVFLIQNSGWMEAFYEDPNSKFKLIVKKLIQEATNGGNSNDVVVCAFNESLPGNPSPLCRYRGKYDSGKIGSVIDGIQLAQKPNSTALADANFVETIKKITSDLANKGQQGILWIVTNNKNSPNNNVNTAALNREYYEQLHGNHAIERVIAFPYKMSLRGPHYDANGLMVYGIAFGKGAGQELKRKMTSPGLSKLFDGALPARLKPLGEEAVTFVPKGTSKSNDVEVFLEKDGKTLDIRFNASSAASLVDIQGVFRNDFYPYTINKARVNLVTNLNSTNIKSNVSINALEKLEPGSESVPLNIRMELPPLKSQWSPEVIFKSGYKIIGTLHLTLADQELSISKDFSTKLSNLFPHDPLPDLFKPPSQSRQSTTSIPVVVSVIYPVWPLVMVFSGFGVLVAAGMAGWMSSRKPRKVVVTIDQNKQVINIGAGRKVELRNVAGEHVATLSRTMLGIKLTKISDQSIVKIIEENIGGNHGN